jgi:hypothetical protein
MSIHPCFYTEQQRVLGSPAWEQLRHLRVEGLDMARLFFVAVF